MDKQKTLKNIYVAIFIVLLVVVLGLLCRTMDADIPQPAPFNVKIPQGYTGVKNVGDIDNMTADYRVNHDIEFIGGIPSFMIIPTGKIALSEQECEGRFSLLKNSGKYYVSCYFLDELGNQWVVGKWW